ncbi:CoA transferase [uncultured Corynebacterium sp.]|uniref:CoA transferase n=1 Tax=uncultured Corynebacterium sp. TaxID=159447 RepID=UPI0025FF816E|nr:CoA transferase [uncultured Corynebacterium sp.]
MIDADQIPANALAGTKVLNLAVNVPGPWAAARLGMLGAEVVKVEPPTGDPLEPWCGSWYAEMAAGASVERVDVKSGAGRTRVGELLAAADVLITSIRPSALARLGLADAVDEHPHLCHVEIVGDSKDPEHPGHDLTYQAEAGSLTPPTLPRVLLGDLLGAERAVTAALALLVRRAATGTGGHARIGLRQAADAGAAGHRHGMTAAGGLLGGGVPAYGLYEVADGWIAVAALEPHFRARLADLVGGDDEETLASYLRSRKSATVMRWAHDHDLPMAAVV